MRKILPNKKNGKEIETRDMRRAMNNCKYDASRHPDLAFRLLSEHGFTITQLASAIGIREQTLYNWMERYKKFRWAVRRGRDKFDSEKVEGALLTRALGVVKVISKERMTKEGEIFNLREEVYVPPEVNACMFWLRNRRPKRWPDTRNQSGISRNVSVSFNQNNIAGIESVSNEKIAEAMTILMECGALDETIQRLQDNKNSLEYDGTAIEGEKVNYG